MSFVALIFGRFHQPAIYQNITFVYSRGWRLRAKDGGEQAGLGHQKE